MAVAENAGAKIGPSGDHLDENVVSSESNVPSEVEKSKSRTDFEFKPKETSYGDEEEIPANVGTDHGKSGDGYLNGTDNQSGNRENLKNKEMRDLVEMLSKLNPMAEEFVPPSVVMANGYNNNNYNLNQGFFGGNGGFGYTNNFLRRTNSANSNGQTPRRKRNGYNGRRRVNTRTSHAQQEEVIRRTVYVSDIDQQVTEEQLAGLFLNCGQVVDCRICGDPNSVLRFAFVEFTDEEGARAALNLAGTMLGFYPVRVLPSKTAIAPVNPTFLPRSEDEREMCSRTIYCTNIDKKITQAELKLFFESVCGEVQRLRLLGDYQHSTRIAFVEFSVAESAIAALNCSGAILGTLPIRCLAHSKLSSLIPGNLVVTGLVYPVKIGVFEPDYSISSLAISWSLLSSLRRRLCRCLRLLLLLSQLTDICWSQLACRLRHLLVSVRDFQDNYVARILSPGDALCFSNFCSASQNSIPAITFLMVAGTKFMLV